MLGNTLQTRAQEELNANLRVFRWNRVLMSFLGLWPENFNRTHFLLNFVYFSYCMFLEYVDLFLHIDNIESVLMNLTENCAFSQIFVRILMMGIYNKSLGFVIGEAMKDFNADDYTEEEIRIFISYYGKAKLFMKLLVANTALTATSFYTKPLLGQLGPLVEYVRSNGENNGTFAFLLPYRFYNFYEINSGPRYFWTYGSQFYFVFVSGFGQTSTDCIMVTLVYHISGQLAVLSRRIENINTDPKNCTSELRRIIKSHTRLLRMGKIIEETFSVSLLSHFLGATSLVCILGYQILVCLAIGETAILGTFFSFMFLVLLILYANCTVGESLVTESDRVSRAYYDCKWYEMSKENARMIILCIMRSQTPLRLTAGQFSTYGLATFTNVLKTSMGYLSVLRTVM